MPPSQPPLLQPLGGLVPDVERIAVLRSNGIGDFVVALPALEALRSAYPEAEVTYLGTAWHPELLEARPGPWDRVVVVPPYPGVRGGDGRRDAPEVLAFLDEQRRHRYDLALQLHGGGGNSNPFVTALGARFTAGSRDVGAPPLDRWLRYSYYQHEVHRFLEVVGLVGAVPVSLEPHLAVMPADRAEADHVLQGVPEPIVAIHPGATDPRRRWPAERFGTVARDVARLGASVAVVGHGPDDERSARVIAGVCGGPVLDLVGGLSLGGMVGVLERARVVVGNDSGPRHLAAAVGTATVGVYWCGNMINAGPLTRARHRTGVSFRSSCPECGADQGRARCSHNPSFVADVPLEEIVEAVTELYEGEETDKAA